MSDIDRRLRDMHVMSDIDRRLRDMHVLACGPICNRVLQDAAAEIERLRAENVTKEEWIDEHPYCDVDMDMVVDAERERCAKIAEQWGHDFLTTASAHDIAAAIRKGDDRRKT